MLVILKLSIGHPQKLIAGVAHNAAGFIIGKSDHTGEIRLEKGSVDTLYNAHIFGFALQQCLLRPFARSDIT